MEQISDGGKKRKKENNVKVGWLETITFACCIVAI
jgi:hypothetical protein